MSYPHHPNVNEQEFYRMMATRRSSRKKFSKYRGVVKGSNPKKPYAVSFTYKGVRYFAGNFADELEAARTYNEWVLKRVGSFAVLNELPE